MQTTVLLIFILIVIYVATKLLVKKPTQPAEEPAGLRDILKRDVLFYGMLSSDRQERFIKRMLHFLAQVKITGINTTVEDTDRIYIAASAIIPVFNFDDWEYFNLHEVLLYPDSFTDEYKQQGEGRNVLGMVGGGAMNHVMILSQLELRQAFADKNGKGNTAIHEFVHLLDKADGEIDGLPESLADKGYIVPWLQLMQREITRIKENESDINIYGSTSKAEFFAVAAEYFFERPELFEKKHPELFEILEKIFKVQQGSGSDNKNQPSLRS